MPAYKSRRLHLTAMLSCFLLLVLSACDSDTGGRSPLSENSELSEASAEVTGTLDTEPQKVLATSATKAAVTRSPARAATPILRTPQFQDLLLAKQGFYQSAGELIYAFELLNPNDIAIVDSVYRVAALDSAGRTIGSDLKSIPLLLPRQQLGIAASLSIDGGEETEEIVLQVTTGSPISLDYLPDLLVVDINYQPSEIYNRVYGLISNGGDRDLEDIRVSAITYDEDDEIIGAGYAFLSFLPAGENTGVGIVLATGDQVGRVKLFPRAPLPAILQNPASKPPYTAGLTVLDQGYSQSAIEVSYGFLVDNPNVSYSLLDSEYRITFLNGAGHVIAVDEGFIDLMLPQQSWGIGNRVFVDENEHVTAMQLLSRVGRFQPTTPKLILETADTTVVTGTMGIVVAGDLINPYERTLNDVHISALVYNSDGRIIGGGINWINNVPSLSSVPIEVLVSAAEPVDSANLYASLAKVIAE